MRRSFSSPLSCSSLPAGDQPLGHLQGAAVLSLLLCPQADTQDRALKERCRSGTFSSHWYHTTVLSWLSATHKLCEWVTLVLWCAGTCFIDLTAWLGLEGNQILQDHVQPSFGYLQMRHHSLSGQSVPALCHLQRHFPSYSHRTSCIALCACCPFSCWWAPLRRFWPSPLQGGYLLFKECVFSFSQSVWERSSYP